MLRVRFPLRQSQGHQDRQPPWHPCGGVGLLARLRLSGVLPRLPDRPHVCHGAAGHAPVRVRRRHVDGRRLPGHHRVGGPAAAEVVSALLPPGRAAFAVQRAEPDVPPPRWTPRSACARVAARPATCASRHAPRASTCTMSRRARPCSTIAASAARVLTCAPEHAITFPLLPKKQAQATPLPVDDEIPERG
mgnify:CR=1 FL=1